MNKVLRAVQRYVDSISPKRIHAMDESQLRTSGAITRCESPFANKFLTATHRSNVGRVYTFFEGDDVTLATTEALIRPVRRQLRKLTTALRRLKLSNGMVRDVDRSLVGELTADLNAPRINACAELARIARRHFSPAAAMHSRVGTAAAKWEREQLAAIKLVYVRNIYPRVMAKGLLNEGQYIQLTTLPQPLPLGQTAGPEIRLRTSRLDNQRGAPAHPR